MIILFSEMLKISKIFLEIIFFVKDNIEPSRMFYLFEMKISKLI